MEPRRKIEELFQRYFKRNVVATLVLLFCCAAIFLLACWGHEVLESKRNAENFVKSNQDRLLRLALDKNVEAIQMFLNEANAKSEKVSYRLTPTPQSRALPLAVGGETLGYIAWSLKPQSLLSIGMLLEYIAFFASLLLLLVYFHWTSKKYIRHHLVEPLEVISSITRSASKFEELKKLQTVKSEIFEIDRIRKTIWGSARRMQRTEKRLRKIQVLDALGDIAGIYSHNIGSPLTNLSMILDLCPEIPTDKKEDAHVEIGHIRHVVNQLLEKYKAAHNGEITSSFDTKQSAVFVPVLVEKVIDTKRWEFRERTSLEFKASFGGDGLGNAFCYINAFEFQQLLSNLINNSVEAIPDKGEIEVTLTASNDGIQIAMRDTGTGIPQEILERLGGKGASFGKKGNGRGVGLGVYHAFQTLHRWGGLLSYESQIGVAHKQGTMAIITLPTCRPPLWHPESIVLTPRTQLVLIDDDCSQGELWNALLRKKLPGYTGIVKQFTSPDDFRAWFLKNGGSLRECFFIVDFEFTDSSETGLDLVCQLHLANQALLVTGLAHNEKIQRRCEELGIQLLMKGTQEFLPFETLVEAGVL